MNKIDDARAEIENKAAKNHKHQSFDQIQILTLENLILRQESDRSTHLSPTEIEMETGIPQVSAHPIAKFDLGLTPFKLTNVQRLTRKIKKKQQTKTGKMKVFPQLVISSSS